MELIASSRYRLARIYIQQEDYRKALAHIEAALSCSDGISDALKGDIFVMAGEISTFLATDDVTRTKTLKYFDKASHIARKGIQGEPDFIQFGISRVYIDRSCSLFSFGSQREARESLAIASKNLPADNIRWQKNLDLAISESRVSEGDVTGAVQAMKHYLSLCQATNSRSNHYWMRHLLEVCLKQEPGYAEALSLLN
jgi:tetratricopeptide (TPR) repeat protein